MKNTLKKVIGAVMAVALLVGVSAVPSQGAQAASASKQYMKTLGLRWDLKKGRTVICNSLFAGVGKKKKAVTYKITKYKVGNVRKKGYKKLTLTCVNTVAYKPKKNEIHKMVKSSHFKKTGIVGANGDSAVLDYNTGISLTKKNKFNVEVNCSDLKAMKSRIYRDNDGCYVDFGNLKQTITITYPEDYDGLCIGFYADNQLTKTKADKMFQKGKTPFGKTSYYKKGKKNSHWMRVRASKKKQPTVTSQPQVTKMPAPTTSPSGNTSIPTASPSGNVQVTTTPTLMPSPSGNTSVTPVPTPTENPSGATPTPTESPDDTPGLRTIVYDGTNGREIRDVNDEGEPFAVIVMDGVEFIMGGEFYGCSLLTSITIPNSVTSIDNKAFSGCSSLTDITIPDSVTSIGDDTFEDCSSLTSITISDGVTSIGDGAFEGCSSLTGITIPDSVTSIGGCVFERCNSLVTIKVSEGNAIYDSRENCNAIIDTATNTLIAGCRSTIIPGSVTSIGVSAFSGCSSMTSIMIPNSVTSIGMTAFHDCSNLTSIEIPDSVKSIDYGAFSGCSSLTGITIPDSVTSIGVLAFCACSSLTSITIPDSVTRIWDETFSDCSSLTSITIPDSVTNIGVEAFSSCSNLARITIPDSVTSIGVEAFGGCSSLTGITWKGTTYTSVNAFESAFGGFYYN